MAEEKLFSMRRVRPMLEMDTIKEAKKFGDRRAFHVLFEAQQYWDNMSRFRRDWKSRAHLTPEGKATLTPENLFVLTPVKS